MSPSSKILHATTTLLSLIILGLAAYTLYLTGHVFKSLATSFPNDEYLWFGSANVRNDDWVTRYPMVTLTYDWSSENFVWVAAGLSAIVGILGLGKEGANLWRRIRNRGVKVSQSTHSAFFITTLASTAVALFSSVIASIYIEVHRNKVQKATCHWDQGLQPGANFICTRELAACNILQGMTRREEGVRVSACREIQLVRWMLIPLALISAVLVIASVLQILSRNRDEEVRENVEEQLEHLKLGDLEEQWDTLPVQQSRVEIQESQWGTLPTSEDTASTKEKL